MNRTRHVRFATASAVRLLLPVALMAACSGDPPQNAASDASDQAGEGITDVDGTADSSDASSDVGDAVSPDGAGLDSPIEADRSTDLAENDAQDDVSEGGETGTDRSVGDDARGEVPLFDMVAIADASTADCQFANHRTVFDETTLLDVWDVNYLSWESIDGALVPIRIRGFASVPAAATGQVPGIVQAHGLGGFSLEKHATNPAAQLDAFVIAYTGPGGGTETNNTSEGRAAGYGSGYRMFDTLADVRGSWFWGHATAAMRGLTCLAERPEVDPDRLGMTGYSGGAVATLISAAVDDRIVAAVPLSGTGAWGVATEAPNAWQHTLLSEAGLSIESDEWTRLLEVLDASVLLPRSNTAILMVNGSTDEFFPLTAHVATFDAIPGTDKRTAIAGNLDHGCFGLTGVESAAEIEARAEIRANGALRLWFHHWFGTDSRYAYLPAAPTVDITPAGVASLVAATVDPGGSELEVEEVKIWWSNDNGVLFGNVVLDRQSATLYGELVGFPATENTITYVDVQYRTVDLLFRERFSLSSRPAIPDGLVPNIRSIDSCFPD